MMATKKISDNSLDFVSGGNTVETSDDSKFLNSLLYHRPAQCDRYGTWRIEYQSHDEEIRTAWASVGVAAFLNDYDLNNSYMVNGKWVSQDEARWHAMEVTGVYLTPEQWDW